MTDSVAGKTAVVTGATSGIGHQVAKDLAARGARVVAVARDPERARALLEELPPPAAGAHQVVLGDLSSLAEMKRVAAELREAAAVIDILINNAGAVIPTRQTTVDGLERTFALNHLAYVVLTLGLLDQVKAAPQGRIVCTSSRLHATHKLDFDDLQLEQKYEAYTAYGRSKLANLLFVRALAKRLAGTPVTVNAVHPGFVRTRMGDDDVSFMGRLFVWMKFMALSPEAGARTTLHAALSAEGGRLSGAYFVKEKPAQPSAAAQDDAAAERLWAESLKLAGIADPTPPPR